MYTTYMETSQSTPIITYTEFVQLSTKDGTVSPLTLIPFLVDKHDITFEEARELIYALQAQNDFKLTPNYTIEYTAANKPVLYVQ